MADNIQPVSITVKRGQGLTQALLQLVQKQNMVMSDGSISASEWNATVDKLAEIENNRKSENKASIFSGGTEKTDWKHNYVVKPEQTIDFTKEEITQIYEAMGVSFSTETSTPEASTPETSVPQTSTPEVSTPETSSPATSSPQTTATQTSNPVTSTPLTGEANAEITKEIKNDNNEKIGSRVVKYDENGRLTKEIDNNVAGKVARETWYEYDENGNLSKYIIREYDENEKETNTHWYKPDGTLVKYGVFTYNSEGKDAEDRCYDPQGNLMTKIEYEYNSEGYTKIINKYDLNGEVKSTTKKLYKTNDVLTTEIITENKDGKAVETKHYYNANGIKNRTTVSEDGIQTKDVSYEYDSEGNVIKEQSNI